MCINMFEHKRVTMYPLIQYKHTADIKCSYLLSELNNIIKVSSLKISRVMDNKLCFIFVSITSMSTLSHSPGLEVQTTFYPSHCKAGKVKEGDHLTVHYIGQFDEDGNKFASSWDTNTPYRFQIGRGQVIKGWEEGLLGMCVGEIRKLKIPPELTLGGNAFENVNLVLCKHVNTESNSGAYQKCLF